MVDSAASSTPAAPEPPSFAQQLEGRTVGDWLVKERFDRSQEKDLTGGYFSEGYLVSRKGHEAYLKAFDLRPILKATGGQMNPIQALATMAAAFDFERKLLRSCTRLDRVVQVLDDGEIYVEPTNPFSYVPYIILEKADRDVRRHLRDAQSIEVAWRLQTLHHVATGLMQLHSGKVVHQDLKPSNILIWETTGAKVSDLGRSSTLSTPGINDAYDFAGDRTYAPPEVLYNHLDPDWEKRRFPIDLYLFGSVIVYLFTQASMSALLMGRFLPPEHRPNSVWKGGWTGTFVGVLPYLQNAFMEAVAEFERQLPAPRIPRRDYRPALVRLVTDMCNPDPSQRGTVVHDGSRSVALNRVVTMLDRLVWDA